MPVTRSIGSRFSYDPLYRLLSATGRELHSPRLIHPGAIPSRPRTKADAELHRQYLYDPVGNIKQLQHRQAGVISRGPSLWSRTAIGWQR